MRQSWPISRQPIEQLFSWKNDENHKKSQENRESNPKFEPNTFRTQNFSLNKWAQLYFKNRQISYILPYRLFY
jgi:hypothetical protein